MKLTSCIATVLLFNAIHVSESKECTVEIQSTCHENCNCRYETNIVRRFLALLSGNDLSICEQCEKKCTKVKKVDCKNGYCDKKSGCICHECWTGRDCSEYQNKHKPKFVENAYKAEVDDGMVAGHTVVQVSATDDDLVLCLNKTNCLCGIIIYRITKGNDENNFKLDEKTGVISIQKPLGDMTNNIPFVLHVSAENVHQENMPSQAFVVVSISKSKARKVARRRREIRQVYSPLITEFGVNIGETFFDFDDVLSFQLKISQNQSDTPRTLSGVVIHLTAKNLKIAEGTVALNLSNVPITPTTKTIDSRTIEVSFSEDIQTNGLLEILFSATVVTQNPLSLLQVSFTLNASSSGEVTHGPVYSKPVYTLYPEVCFGLNPSVEYTSIFSNVIMDLNITLPHANFSLVIEITTFLNTLPVLHFGEILSLELSNTVTASYPQPVPQARDDTTVLNFGYVQSSHPNTSSNTISIKISILVNDSHYLRNDSTLWLGGGIGAGAAMVWAGNQPIKIVKEVPDLIVNLTTVNETAPNRYCRGDNLIFGYDVHHSPGSTKSAKNVTIYFKLSDTVVYQSHTISKAATKQTSTNHVILVIDTGEIQFGEHVTGTFTVKVKDTSMTPLASLNVACAPKYETDDGTVRPLDYHVAKEEYTVRLPLFEYTTNISERDVQVGKVIEFCLKIHINKIALSGVVEVTLPTVNDSLPIMVFLSDSLSVTYGDNLVTSIPQEVESFRSTINVSDSYNRLDVELGSIQNKDFSTLALSNVNENTVTVKFKALFDDTPHVNNCSKYWIGTGVVATNGTIWVGSLSFFVTFSLNRRPMLKVVASVNDTYVIQGNIVQYNATIMHDVDSELHAEEVEMLWLLPDYMKFKSLVDNMYNMEHNIVGNNVVFKRDILKFVDRPVISFTVVVDPGKVLKAGKNLAVTPIAMSYKNHHTQNRIFDPLVPKTLEIHVPHPETNSADVLSEFYDQGYIADKSTSEIYFCKVAAKRDTPSCFWSGDKGMQWRAVDVLVVNIIGFDSNNGYVFGIGNNKKSYMQFLASRGKWFAVKKDRWTHIRLSLSAKEIVTIGNDDFNTESPLPSKETILTSGDKWGANTRGIYYQSNGQPTWEQKALW